MDSICPSGVLKIGFVDTYFPFFYFDGIKTRGLSIELWRIIASSFDCTSMLMVEYYYTSEAVMKKPGWELVDNGNLAAIKRGDIFVDLTMNGLSPPRVKDFRYTTDVVIDTLSLYQAVNSTSEQESWTPYQFFFVFSPYILALIIVSSMIMNITNMANTRLRSPLGLFIRFFVIMIFSISTMTLFFLHGAVFKGNMIITAQPELHSWNEIMIGFKRGSLQLVESVSNFEDYQYDDMLGTKPSPPTGSTAGVISKLCSNPSTAIAALYDTQVTYISDRGMLPEHCQIHRIPPQGNSSLIGDSFMPSNFMYLMPRNTTLKTVFKINQIILKLFSYEKIQEFWLKKELRHPSLSRDVSQQSEMSSDLPPLSLVSLAGIFIAFAVGLVFSFAVFILEVTTYRFPLCRRLHKFIVRLL